MGWRSPFGCWCCFALLRHCFNTTGSFLLLFFLAFLQPFGINKHLFLLSQGSHMHYCGNSTISDMFMMCRCRSRLDVICPIAHLILLTCNPHKSFISGMRLYCYHFFFFSCGIACLHMCLCALD